MTEVFVAAAGKPFYVAGAMLFVAAENIF